MAPERFDVAHLRLAGDESAQLLCWSCQRETPPHPFCDQCSKLQPLAPKVDSFNIFGLERRLTLDASDLEERFYELSRTFHPDFFQQRSDNEQHLSLEYSAAVNTAYRTLRDPWSRVEYLIQLEEGSVTDIRAQAPADLLEEVLEVQELLETAQEGDVTDAMRAELETVRERFATMQQERLDHLEALSRRWDDAMDAAELEEEQRRERGKGILEDLKRGLAERKYLANVVGKVEAALTAS